MHRSRLRQLLIDCAAEDFDRNVAFWSAAVGAEVETDPADPEYVELRGHAGELGLGLQRLGEGSSRIHLDIESDDVEAEVARLRKLGAVEVARIESWVVLRDPAGLPFCVIRAQPGFNSATTTWE